MDRLIAMRDTTQSSRVFNGRRGAASLDYILVLGVVLPMALVILRIAPRMIRSAYEMVCVLVSWPLM